MKTITCSNCGSVYEEKRIDLPLNDKDDYSCDVCEKTLKEWKGTYMFQFKLLEKKENHKQSKDNFNQHINRPDSDKHIG